MTHINFDLYNQPRSEIDPLYFRQPPAKPLPVGDSVKLQAILARLREELTAIAEMRMECGCMPCVGSCRSKDAYELTLDGIRESASRVLCECFPLET